MKFCRKCLSSYKWVRNEQLHMCAYSRLRLLMKDTWSCLTDLNRSFKCAHTRRGIHMSVWCILTLMCWPALQRVAFLSDYSLTYDPPHSLPVRLWRQAGLSCGHFSSTTPASQCPLASTHRLPNKQTRSSNFMPSSLGGVPAAGLTLFIYSQFHTAPWECLQQRVWGPRQSVKR